MNMRTYLLSQDGSTAETLSDAGAETVERVTGFWENPEVQQWLIATPLRILIVIIIALILQAIARRLIDRAADGNIAKGGKLSKGRSGKKKDQNAEVRDDARLAAMHRAREQRRHSRVKTLAGVGRSAAVLVIWTWAVLAILGELGINVGPIIASAGVIGVALGFGAQSLVMDFLAGVFMLLEDQYGVGDVVDVGDDIVGDVEEISLRITTIRDIDGTLWYVRNGEIMRVGNLSDEYSIARIEVPVALSNDMDEAWNIILDAVTDISNDPLISEYVMETPTVNGLTQINPDSVTFRASVKTLPAKQWDVQRIIQSKLVNILRDKGVALPYPNGIGMAPQAQNIATGEENDH
ncbi:mechanosensitive ion channel protein MscS [Corynebacterium yudongzhengii]|uniref:Mechanosensitive ion channel family protein n=1 Tax=Corynebacterium yudongzhengii TaxID=2080740 RepID=A0A2U1T8T7_9CORY|nr:mechanosensitive ion channel family protein [Corynebacterium yudongzhengii]AWB82523.1 mechanosensitive ion channel protein MscS [Corynebacterium yudongzhengii]PWC02421.1 mechanosensitive ion channel family protein [Corynebacterium yudongzhengii]